MFYLFCLNRPHYINIIKFPLNEREILLRSQSPGNIGIDIFSLMAPNYYSIPSCQRSRLLLRSTLANISTSNYYLIRCQVLKPLYNIGMGLRNLTLKTKAVNESLNPSIPFVVEKGSIGQIKLDLKQFTMVLDKIDITLRFKTPEQLLEFGRNYKKM